MDRVYLRSKFWWAGFRLRKFWHRLVDKKAYQKDVEYEKLIDRVAERYARRVLGLISERREVY